MRTNPRLGAVEIDNSPDGNATPVVFLHGFGGLAKQWWGFQTSISFNAPTLAFDMPGHGDSVDYPDSGPPAVAAKAVIAELKERGIEKAHFVGHSMGGAISSLIGLTAPEVVASLTLLAPGGYGTEFNHPLLMQWANAKTHEELVTVLPHFFGASFEVSEKMIDFQAQARSKKGVVEALVRIGESLSRNGEQGMLPVDDVLRGDYPVTMVWGDKDAVLPVSHALAVKDKVDLHILEGVGHSPVEEATDAVRKIILDQLT
jgi:pyruvate dehydrogenase E2 component (dihydrolipoamide acetyltransferase)